jgi:hypothetical protein
VKGVGDMRPLETALLGVRHDEIATDVLIAAVREAVLTIEFRH